MEILNFVMRGGKWVSNAIIVKVGYPWRVDVAFSRFSNFKYDFLMIFYFLFLNKT